MKKILFPVLAIAALFTAASCEKNLDIPQKGVTAYESFYQTDEDAEAAIAAAYARFATYVTGRGNGFIYTPLKAAINNCGDDMYAAGSNFGDNDYMAALNEFRYDSGCEVLSNLYTGLFLANYACNLVIDNFKEGLPEGGPTATTKRVVAEARVMRAYIYFILTTLWNTPPFIDHVIADGLPYNSDQDPDNPKSHEDLYKWIASECEAAATDLDERKSTTDKDGAVKVTKGFAWALQGKALLFVKDYSGAKTALKKVIDSGKYALVPGEKYWQNFHIEGDANEEKVFESNIEYNSGISAWGGINQRSTWMEANIWNWRSDHFVAGAAPQSKYTGGVDGWGGLGVPQWFGDEFFANDGHSYRFDATIKHIDDAVYGMVYGDAVEEGGKKVNDMTLEEKKACKAIGIADVKDGLYGQSFWLPFKQLLRSTDSGAYGNNVRLNNNVVMRYAEVLLLYAEACLQSGDNAGALTAVNQIRTRAGISALASVDMNVLKKEKSYELWLEGSRWFDLVRWGDTGKVEKAGQAVPKLFDKLYRAPKSGESVKWENGTEANSRFYTIDTHEAIDANWKVGFQAGKHEFFPYPTSVMDKNPNLVQNPGW
ncbi:MAG: RagB/SusD family nutrient uptake outer membrane protein [Bacteroidales bacterium]|nr:RagB/SusD family nutrient uptake outer membrane protein [Bacteroidales bacterium]